MDSPLRQVRLHSGHVLTTWDNHTRASTGQHQLRYALLPPACAVHGTFLSADEGRQHEATCPVLLAFAAKDALFCGADYGVAPAHAVDSDAALLGLLGFLTLRPEDTDADYFAEYTPAQLEWAQADACESLSADVSVAEEAGGCACGVLWENVAPRECPDAPAVVDFEVVNHGCDGSQYFPGCGAGRFSQCDTGDGDTSAEALEDALEMMAQDDVTVSPLQERRMRDSLSAPDHSAYASLDHDDCAKDADGACTDEHDWRHRVTVRFNVREAK